MSALIIKIKKMFTIKFIDKRCYNDFTKQLNQHINNGNKGEFEIHLEDAFGSPYYANKILNYAEDKNIELKTYSTGKILDGGVLLIFGSRTNIAYTCTELYISNKPILDKELMDLYFESSIYQLELRYVFNEEFEFTEYDEEWHKLDYCKKAYEFLEYEVFEEIRHGYKSSKPSPRGIKVEKLNPNVYNGHICKCKICRSKFKPVPPSDYCTCGEHYPFTMSIDQCRCCFDNESKYNYED